MFVPTAERRQRLEQEAHTHQLAYLAYLVVPQRGSEGFFLEVGSAGSGCREVAARVSSEGRSELHWVPSSTYSQKRAEELLAQLQESAGLSLSEHLHATICQTLTAAHLHLELGLLTTPQASEEFEQARQLLQEATGAVRDLIDHLAEGEALR